MDFKAAIKRINKDFCNLAYADYMKDQWDITVGYNTHDPYLVLSRKKIADWQLINDCSNSLCTQSYSQPVTVLETAGAYPTGQCVLNPPLSAFNRIYNWPGNVNEILIASFTR
jgi:hypothetical protein